jgi:c-di-GMP-binding flagellar brake protein YcgR
MSIRAPLFLLQYSDVQWIKQDDPLAGIIFIVGIVVIGAGLLILNIVKNGIGSTGLGKGLSMNSSAAGPRRYSGMAFHRLAKSFGLDKDQTKLLEQVFKQEGITDPHRIMNNPALLYKYFKRIYKRIENSADTDEEAQQRLALLFSVRNTLESSQNANAATGSSQQIVPNMTTVLAFGDDSYPVRVLAVKGQQVIVENPQNSLGTPIRIPRGARVNLSFFTKSSKGYAFEGQAGESSDSPRGPVLQVLHTGRAKNLVQRRFKRRQLGLSCYFYLVKLETAGSGRKKTVRMIVDNHNFTGTILDISLGGCAIKTNAGINAGIRLKIEIDFDTAMVAVLGQVLRINRSGALSTIMHVKFLKVPRRAMNAINAMVFEYNQD